MVKKLLRLKLYEMTTLSRKDFMEKHNLKDDTMTENDFLKSF